MRKTKELLRLRFELGLGQRQLLLVMDAIVAARVARSGWPKTLVIAASNNAAQVQVVPAHFNASAWVLFGLYGIAHFALLYLVWRSWRSSTGTTNRA